MIGDVLEPCRRCGEEQRRVDIRDDRRGRWWLVACSPVCRPEWMLVSRDSTPTVSRRPLPAPGAVAELLAAGTTERRARGIVLMMVSEIAARVVELEEGRS